VIQNRITPTMATEYSPVPQKNRIERTDRVMASETTVTTNKPIERACQGQVKEQYASYSSSWCFSSSEYLLNGQSEMTTWEEQVPFRLEVTQKVSAVTPTCRSTRKELHRPPRRLKPERLRPHLLWRSKSCEDCNLG